MQHKLKRKAIEVGAASFIALSNGSMAFAQFNKPQLNNPAPGATNFGDLLVDIIRILLIFSGAVAVLFLIIGGFRYIISSGNAEQVEGAKKTILYALLGLIIIFIAFILVQFIQEQLGVRNPDFKV